MGPQLRHRQTKGAETVARSPTVTAPHLDSTPWPWGYTALLASQPEQGGCGERAPSSPPALRRSLAGSSSVGGAKFPCSFNDIE